MKTLTQLTNEADDLFSKVIRLKYADENGNVWCVTCGNSYHWKEIQNGHFISRDKFNTRYDLRNCHPQCGTCNSAHNDNRDSYRIFMLRTYPGGTITELLALSFKFVSSLDKRIILEKTIKECKSALK